MLETVSSLSRDAWIVVNAFQGDAGALLHQPLAGTQMFGENVPHRHSLLFVHRSPSRHLVALAGLKRAAVVELEVGDPASDAFRGRAGITEAADADHVAALLVIRIGIEQIVADVFERILDLAAGHALDVGFRIGDGGFGPYV